MLIKYHTSPVPFTSVIDDLVTRDGPPTSDNYPFFGMSELIMKKARSTPRAIVFERLCNFDKDYDFTHKSKDYPNGYPATNIEEVPASLIETYITQVLFSIVNYNAGGVREFSAHNSREQHSMQDSESGAVTYESENLLEKQEYSYEEYLKWQRQLPYLVKRMHAKSQQCGFHVMSAIRARAKCQKDKVNITPKNLIERTIFLCGANGNISGVVRENTGQFQQYFSKWIRGHDEVRDSYYDDMLELTYICSRLEVDLSLENPVRYNDDFIKTLVSDYIITNSKLFMSTASEIYGGGLPPQVRKLIAGMSLDDLDSLEDLTTGVSENVESLPLSSYIDHVKIMFMNSSLSTRLSNSVVTQNELMKFSFLYYQCTGKNIRVQDLTVIDDYYCKSEVEMLTVPVALFDTENSGMGNTAILHRSGTFIMYSIGRLNNSFAWISISKLCDIMTKYKSSPPERKSLLSFRWEVCDNEL
jgi:hypothetical protein